MELVGGARTEGVIEELYVPEDVASLVSQKKSQKNFQTSVDEEESV